MKEVFIWARVCLDIVREYLYFLKPLFQDNMDSNKMRCNEYKLNTNLFSKENQNRKSRIHKKYFNT